MNFVIIRLLIYSVIQVHSDSGVPDNIYTGGMYYERIGNNKWLMTFMVVQKIKVFLEVIFIYITARFKLLTICLSSISTYQLNTLLLLKIK